MGMPNGHHLAQVALATSPPCPQPECLPGPRQLLPPSLPPCADFVVDQAQAVKFALDVARGMAFLHTLEPLIPRHSLNSRSITVS